MAANKSRQVFLGLQKLCLALHSCVNCNRGSLESKPDTSRLALSSSDL